MISISSVSFHDYINHEMTLELQTKKRFKRANFSCKGWAANGYCESDDYTEEEKRDKCAKTCGLC